jgi:hypothetical protein
MEQIQPHDIVVMPERGNAYTTYNTWVEKNAPSYLTEYETQCYTNYFKDSLDVLSVICMAPHSTENPITLCLCRSLLTDKLILVGAADTQLEGTQFDSGNKVIREMLNTDVVNRIYDIIVTSLYPATYTTLSLEKITQIKDAISSLFDEFNITCKEDK